MNKIMRMSAIVGIVALAAAACGDAPEDEPGDGADATTDTSVEEEEPAEAFRACAVLDVGGVDDRSFNQSAWKGMEDAAAAADNVEVSYVESQSDADYVPNLTQQAESCDAVVAVGGLLSSAVAEVAPQYPEIPFMQIDAPSADIANVWGVTYYTEQSAFLGGYLAASISESGVVATYGGINVGRPVTGYMEGYRLGVDYFNQQKGTDVQVLGWNGSDGEFAESFTDPAAGRALTEAFASQGADVVFPVAGGAGTGSFTAAEAAGEGLAVIWVDFPGCEFYAEYCAYIPTSVTKAIPDNVTEFVTSAAEGNAPTGDLEGTLENEGTGITEFNEWDAQISDETKTELEDIRAGIIDGSIEVPPVQG